MNGAASAAGGRRPRWPLLVSGLAAFVLYVSTLAHQHVGDTPVYLEQIRSGERFTKFHLLSRWLASAWIHAVAVVSPDTSPFDVVSVLCAAEGALCIGCFHALLRRLSGLELLPAIAAAGLALTYSFWTQSTTFELHILPTLVFVVAALVFTRPSASPLWVGVLQALAICCHLLAASTVVVWSALFATGTGARRARFRDVGVFLGTAIVLVLATYAAAGMPLPISQLFGAANDGALHHRVATGGTLSGVLRGFQQAFVSVSAPRTAFVGQAGVVVMSMAFVVGTAMRRGSLQRRVPTWWALPPLWCVAFLPLIARVEPDNPEYFLGPVAGLIAWGVMLGADLAATSARPLLVRAVLCAAALVFDGGLLAGNWPSAALRMRSPAGFSVGLVGDGAGGQSLVDGWGNAIQLRHGPGGRVTVKRVERSSP